jgi:hypothetical protein
MRRSRKKSNVEDPSQSQEMSGRTATALETAPQSVGDTSAAGSARERIAMRAYELYLARGGGEGGALEDWLEAEREVSSTNPDRNAE